MMLIPVYLDVGYADAEVGVGIILHAGLESSHHVLLFRLRHQQDAHLRLTLAISGEGDESDGGRNVVQHLHKIGLVAPAAKSLRVWTNLEDCRRQGRVTFVLFCKINPTLPAPPLRCR